MFRRVGIFDAVGNLQRCVDVIALGDAENAPVDLHLPAAADNVVIFVIGALLVPIVEEVRVRAFASAWRKFVDEEVRRGRSSIEREHLDLPRPFSSVNVSEADCLLMIGVFRNADIEIWLDVSSSATLLRQHGQTQADAAQRFAPA